MRRSNRLAVVMALLLSGQIMMASDVWAQGSDPVVNASSSIASVIATVIALPVKAATCVTTVTLGGVGYGLTAGHSDFVRQEFLGGLPYACGTQLHTTPQAVEPFTREPQWPR